MGRVVPWVSSYVLGVGLFILAFVPNWESNLKQNMVVAAGILAVAAAFTLWRKVRVWPSALLFAGIAGLVTYPGLFLILLATGLHELE